MRRSFAVLLALACMLFYDLAEAKIILVPSDYQYIQDAIDAASDGDIVQVAAGTYTGTKNENLDYNGKAITVQSENGPDNCTIDCRGSGRGFYFVNGETASSVLSGFTIRGASTDLGGGIHCLFSSPTIQNCIIKYNRASDFGGGIYCCGLSSPTITNCTFTDNSADYGAGISCCLFSNPTIQDCTFSNNDADYGGAVYSDQYSSPDLNGCTLSDNTADYGGALYCDESSTLDVKDSTISGNRAYRYGGAIHCSDLSRPSITGCTFDDNEADYGGAVYCGRESSPTIVSCIFSNNLADYYGGAIHCEELSSPWIYECMISGNRTSSYYGRAGGGIYCSPSATLNIANSTLIGNSSRDGGGVYCDSSSPTIVNCLICENTASANGGGLSFSVSAPFISTPTMENCTLSGNSAGEGGGIHCSGLSLPRIINCILWNDTPNELQSDFDLLVTYSDIEGGYPGEGNIEAVPMFIGGGDYHLTAGSPCIDAGKNRAYVNPRVDFEGDRRPLDGDRDGRKIVDMGADEYLPIVLSLTPDKTIIERGEELSFGFLISNNSGTSEVVFFGTQVTLPGGRTIPLIGPDEQILDPYQSVSGQQSHTLPMFFPLGASIYRGYVGNLGEGIIDIDVFEFEVIAPAEALSGSGSGD